MKILMIFAMFFSFGADAYAEGDMPMDFLADLKIPQVREWLDSKMSFEVENATPAEALMYLTRNSKIHVEMDRSCDGRISVRLKDVSVRYIIWVIQKNTECKIDFNDRGILRIHEATIAPTVPRN